MISEFKIGVDGITLRGELYLPAQSQEFYPAVIVCHGIPSGRPAEPGDKGYRHLAASLAGRGFLTAIFNFRGCGESEGNLDLEGWCRDLGAVIDWLWERDDVDRERLNLLGFSGGAAVSCQRAALDGRVSALGLAACPAEFSCLFPPGELAAIIKWARQAGVIRDGSFPPHPEQWLQRLHAVEARKFISAIAPRPLLLLHGREDDLVPVQEACDLHRQAGERAELIIIEGAGHRLRNVPEAVETARDWLLKINRMTY